MWPIKGLDAIYMLRDIEYRVYRQASPSKHACTVKPLLSGHNGGQAVCLEYRGVRIFRRLLAVHTQLSSPHGFEERALEQG